MITMGHAQGMPQLYPYEYLYPWEQVPVPSEATPVSRMAYAYHQWRVLGGLP